MIMSVPPPVRGELVMYQPSNLFPVYYIWCDPGKVYLYLGTVLHVSCSIYISIHVPLYYLPVPKCANVHAFRGQMLQKKNIKLHIVTDIKKSGIPRREVPTQ